MTTVIPGARPAVRSGHMQGRYALLEMLRAEGVEYIFGNPGTSEAAIMDILPDYPDLKYVLVVQEGVAIGLAEGYARASGNVAFVSLHIDNGLGNALSLLIDSKYCGTPMVVTAGNKDVRKLAEGRSDLVEMARPFTKWAAEITHPEQFPSAIRRAFTEARTPPTGPTFLSFAGNALDDLANVEIVPSKPHFTLSAADPRGIEAAAEALARAERPILVVGDRVAQYRAVAEAVRVAERLGARVYGHASTEVNFPTGHPQWFGLLSLRQPAARHALEQADAVLVVGAPAFQDFFYLGGGRTVGPKTVLIHIDPNGDEIGRSEPTDIGILAAPAAALAALDTALAERLRPADREAAASRAASLAAETARLDAAFHEAARQGASSRPMAPAAMAAALGRALPANAVVFDDAISTRAALHAGVKFNEPGSLIGARGSAIGWGMGGALGVKLAHPDRPVVAVVGDGSAMMTVQALWTARAAAIPVVYVICNNASYRILKLNMQVYRRLRAPDAAVRYPAMDFAPSFDFAAIARGFGLHGVRIEDPERIGPELDRALALGEPAVLDVIIDGAV